MKESCSSVPAMGAEITKVLQGVPGTQSIGVECGER